jgi:hypothetical protein
MIAEKEIILYILPRIFKFIGNSGLLFFLLKGENRWRNIISEFSKSMILKLTGTYLAESS